MGGLVLDVFVAFLFRTAANCFRRIRGRSWPSIKAVVFQSYLEGSGGFGCAATTISYDYRVGGEKYSATHDEPCLSHSSGKYFAQLYPEGKEIAIRYKPDDPSRSVALI